MVMLKGDVLPHLVQMQFKKIPKRSREELPNPDASVTSFNTGARGMTTPSSHEGLDCKKKSRYFQLPFQH